MDDILFAREERSQIIQKYISNDNLCIIVKANIPGPNKNSWISNILIHLFKDEVCKQFSVKECHYIVSADGPYYILIMNSFSPWSLKKKMINIEDNHPLGRLIDLDVYFHQKGSMSRKDLLLPNRKCYLCKEDAFICARSKKHSLSELLIHMEKQVISFLEEDFFYIIFDSITLEANLHPKFGLVTKHSSGAHKDMDYGLMEKAKVAIVPFLTNMIFCGCDYTSLDEAFFYARQIGIVAEEKMLEETAGVNCYKGLIFVLGLACVAVGYAIRNQELKWKVFEIVAYMTRNIFHELDNTEDTFGKYAYVQYGFKGVRGEVFLGLPAVKKALSTLNQFDVESDEALTMTLIDLVREIDDSVLLKRANSFEKYHYFKNKIAGITYYDKTQIEEVTEEAVKENISIGGAADLLVVTLFLNKVIKRYFN